jgi:hypothetical protein
MRKFLTFVLYLVAALAVAGVFGILHDQISYSVSPEYYTKFKFIQFGLEESTLPDRVRAGEVGFLASWWMGVPLGLFTGVAGFIHRDVREMRRALGWTLIVMVLFVLGFSLCGLAYGYLQTQNLQLNDYGAWFVPPDLVNARRFICVGYMHNSAYLGGALAIPIAWLFNITYRLRAARVA